MYILLLLSLFFVVIELSPKTIINCITTFSSIRLKKWKKGKILLFKWGKMNSNRNVWNIYI